MIRSSHIYGRGGELDKSTVANSPSDGQGTGYGAGSYPTANCLDLQRMGTSHSISGTNQMLELLRTVHFVGRVGFFT